MKRAHKKAETLAKLNLFFRPFALKLSDFCQKLALSGIEEEKYLSYLLSCIFYKEITLSTFNGFENCQNFLITLAAESVSERKIKRIVSKLSKVKLLKLLCHSLKHMREGSWIILKALGELFKKEELTLLANLKTKYFDGEYFEFLLNRRHIYRVEKLNQLLTEHAENQIREISKILPTLIDLMVTSPVKTFENIEDFKKQNNQNYVETKEVKNLRKIAIKSSKEWKFLFAAAGTNSLEEMNEFLKFYGLHGYYLKSSQYQATSILNLLKQLLKLFQNPTSISPDDVHTYILFVLRFMEKLHVFHREPIKIIKGFDHLAYSLATRGVRFSCKPWLISVLTGLKNLKVHLKKKGLAFTLSMVPIIIFDQSKEAQFKRNQSFIRKIAKTTIWHLSREQTLHLAKALNLSRWIDTGTEKGMFGFGGARNCQLLLAPVIHGAILKGIKNFKELIEMDTFELRKLFDVKVLGKGSTFVHLGEDDIAIPSQALLEAAWAEKHHGSYMMRPSIAIGRNTSYVNPFLDLQSVVRDPAFVFSSSKWVDSPPFSAGMKGQTTKPKFALPTPFGNEESHVQNLLVDYDFFQHPILHLAEARFPKKLYPDSPLDGLEQTLKTFLPYSMHISLVTSLIDADNKHSRSILPWNDSHLKSSSLNDVCKTAFSTFKEMKRRFWQNFYDLFNDLKNKDLPIGSDILALTVVNEIPGYKSLENFYKSVQKDALFFLELGKAIIELRETGFHDYLQKAKNRCEHHYKTKIEKLPISKSLLILAEFIESWEFKSNNSPTRRFFWGQSPSNSAGS